ncbi:hypothetical protein CU102_27800 [Phyllobacterium brassicacearum]|uniref:Uncharacterized protein n=1 Tax=Phyllobacterium brassicacearum TaxID=314235 RepID=A0A2P7AXX2_9HYPH|nr:hypothetical protein CU102_27800 [Phyllobacterium brassicacearum]TDQ09130.1 hypothetical protein DEV91_1581 [Phyllobacterium brassicacearum]
METSDLANGLYMLASICFAPSSLILVVVLYRRVTSRAEFWSDVVYWRDDLDRNRFIKLNRFKTQKLPIISQEIRALYATRFGKTVCKLWLCSFVAVAVVSPSIQSRKWELSWQERIGKRRPTMMTVGAMPSTPRLGLDRAT